MWYAIGHSMYAVLHVIIPRGMGYSSCLVQNNIEKLVAGILGEGTTRMRTEWPSLQHVGLRTNEWMRASLLRWYPTGLNNRVTPSRFFHSCTMYGLLSSYEDPTNTSHMYLVERGAECRRT